MAIRYYPSSKIRTNLTTSGAQFTSQNGTPYRGKYYVTFDGQFFSGPDPKTGPSERLTPNKFFAFSNSSAIGESTLNQFQKKQLSEKASIRSVYPDTDSYIYKKSTSGKPTSYFPQPTDTDYRRGYITRYFTKKENERGYITEISQNEYNDITNGTANYDVSIYQVTKILWKLTGPLKSQRQSQYNVIPGIIDTNQRLTETANKTFLGIVDFIGGDYSKFARPTP